MTNKEIINEIKCLLSELDNGEDAVSYLTQNDVKWLNENIKALQPKIKPIGYRECSDAMLKMWMDNVLTDGEYYRIMDKLNAKWSKMNEVAE
jgi:uncharacterized protein YehS (DUF1456 family)